MGRTPSEDVIDDHEPSNVDCFDPVFVDALLQFCCIDFKLRTNPSISDVAKLARVMIHCLLVRQIEHNILAQEVEPKLHQLFH